jgi:predicted O-linked N-acetylglucosamine transferase (SPINDLY family)
LELEPLHAGAYGNLATALQEQGLVAEALAAYRRSLELEPRDALIHSNSLMAMQYQTGITSAALAAAHAQYDARHAVGLQAEWKPHRRPTDRERRLRLGLVSPDFYTHPVGFFLVGIVENLDPREVEVFCYSDRTRGDGMTSRFEAAACGWRNVAALSDAELAEQIRADDIDMAGHTAHNRLLVFARKPAPIQITWIGYQGTTGLQAMDYVLADRYMIPPGTETNFAEKVLRLPESYVCYEPPQQAPAVSPLPAESNGFVTFASFNNLAKINAEVVALWSQILRRLPASRLILKYQGLGDASVGRRYLELFAAAGVPAQQIVLQPRSPFAAYMATYAEVDIGLDPFPFSGSATTCESLWMGVPVVTWPGETFASRHGLSHLSNIGLTETIVHSAEEYVELAVALAHDLPWLAALRAVLRTRMAASPLCDAKRGAQGLTDVLRKVWREWNQKE